MTINSRLRILGVLFGLDIVLTTIAVGFMGAIELNPMIHLIGFSYAMVAKIIISIAALYIFYKCAPKAQSTARITLTCLLGVYGAVAVSNTYQLLWGSGL